MARSWTGGDTSTLVAYRTPSWANSAVQNTENTVDLGSPDAVPRSSSPGLVVVVRNPSAVTQLTGEVRLKVDDSGTTRYPKLTPFTVAAGNGDGESFVIDGGLLAGGGQISLKNATALGGADTFRASVWIYAF